MSADYSVQDSLVVGVGPLDSTTGLCTVSVKGKIHNVGDAAGSLLDLQFTVTESQDAVYGNGDDGLHGSLLLDVETVSLAPDAFSSTDGTMSLQVHPDDHYLIFHLLSTEGPIDSNSANDTFAIPIGTPSVSMASAKSVRPHRPVLLDPSANLSDPNSVDFNGGKLSVQFSAGADPKNTIFLQKSGTGSSQLKVSNGRLLLGENQIGTVAGGKNGIPLDVSFTASTSQDLVRRVLRQIAIKLTKHETSGREVSVTLTDENGNASIPGNVTLNLA